MSNLPTVALCCIVKLENRYIRNFIDYHRKLGVTMFYVYDHNMEGEDNLLDVLGDLVKECVVEIIPWQDHKVTAGVYEAFEDCARRHLQDWDYIVFLDADEFIFLNTKYQGSLPKYLFMNRQVFSNYMGIALNWVVYDDNDLLEYDPTPVQYRFTRPAHNTVDFAENYHVKTILNMGYIRRHMDMKWGCKSPHHFYKKTNSPYYCDSNGHTITRILPKINRVVTANAYIRHYRTKTMGEYLDNKIVKLTKFGYINVDFDDQFFFSINLWTKEKQEMYREYVEKMGVYWKDHMAHEEAQEDPMVTVVGCLFGDSGQYVVYEPMFFDPHYDFVLITDGEINSLGWRTIHVDDVPQMRGMSVIERTKYVKTHLFEFCDTPYAIYSDTTVQWRNVPHDMVRAFVGSGCSLGFMNHPDRTAIQDEIDAWVKRTGDEKYLSAISLYSDIQEYLIFFCCLFIAKNDDKAKTVLSRWWDLISQYFGEVSRTDQIFLPYVIEQCNREGILGHQDGLFVMAPSVVASEYLRRVRIMNGVEIAPKTTGRVLTKYGDKVIRMFHFK